MTVFLNQSLAVLSAKHSLSVSYMTVFIFHAPVYLHLAYKHPRLLALINAGLALPIDKLIPYWTIICTSIRP